MALGFQGRKNQLPKETLGSLAKKKSRGFAPKDRSAILFVGGEEGESEKTGGKKKRSVGEQRLISTRVGSSLAAELLLQGRMRGEKKSNKGNLH